MIVIFCFVLSLERLLYGIAQLKQTLASKVTEPNPEVQEELSRQLDATCKRATSEYSCLFIHKYLNKKKTQINLFQFFCFAEIRIASQSTDYVNRVLDRMRSGVPDGGIDDF